MPPNRYAISLNSYSYGEYDLAQCLAQIARTPIRAVELPAEQFRPGSLIPELMVDESLQGDWRHSLADLRGLLADGGFSADSVDAFCAVHLPRGVEMVQRRVDFAVGLGAPFVIFGCGHYDDDDTRAVLYRHLAQIADYAGDRGITACLEIHGGITQNASECLQTLETVNRENLRINFDTANILYYNRDLDGVQEARQLAEVIAHVHLKDTAGGHLSGPLTPLGEGRVDFPGTFAVLQAAGFTGPYALEIETFHGHREGGAIEDYQQDVLASINYLRKLGQFPD